MGLVVLLRKTEALIRVVVKSYSSRIVIDKMVVVRLGSNISVHSIGCIDDLDAMILRWLIRARQGRERSTWWFRGIYDSFLLVLSVR